MLHPALMTSAERNSEISQILGIGIVRLLAQETQDNPSYSFDFRETPSIHGMDRKGETHDK